VRCYAAAGPQQDLLTQLLEPGAARLGGADVLVGGLGAAAGNGKAAPGKGPKSVTFAGLASGAFGEKAGRIWCLKRTAWHVLQESEGGLTGVQLLQVIEQGVC
jgi:hypothetical protein